MDRDLCDMCGGNRNRGKNIINIQEYEHNDLKKRYKEYEICSNCMSIIKDTIDNNMKKKECSICNKMTNECELYAILYDTYLVMRDGQIRIDDMILLCPNCRQSNNFTKLIINLLNN